MDLARAIVRRRAAVLLAWGVIIPTGFATAHALGDRMVATTRLDGSESAAVEDILLDRFASPTAQPLVLVMRGLATERAALLEQVALIDDALRAVPVVRTVVSAASTPDTLLIGDEPGSAVLVVGIDARQGRADSPIVALRAATGGAAARLNAVAPTATFHWTGAAALSLDLRGASSGEARRAELRALPLLLVLLLVAFRSVVAALLPVLLGGLVIGVGLGAALLASSFGAPSVLLANVASILGLALGVDYSLLTVTRFREALAHGDDARAASIAAIRSAGRTILLAGSTVALGFAGLLIVPVHEIRSVGLGGLAVTAVAVLLATTLLPAVLSLIGRGVDRGRLGPPPSAEPSAVWARIGMAVTAHPWRVLLLAGAPLLLLSLPALRLSSAAPREEWLPPAMESARALADLAAIERAAVAHTLPVVVDVTGLDDAARWNRVARIGAMFADHPHVGEVRSVPALAATFGVPPAAFARLMPAEQRAHFVSGDDAFVRIDVVPARDAPQSELAQLVHELRARAAAGGGFVRVGGVAAFQADYELAVRRAFPLVAAVVIGSILLALSVGFRSVLIPLKATLLNLLTVGAGFGAMVLVFQDGIGSGLFGIPHPLSGVFPAIPILAFCIVFGLSMDYEVFLVGRIAESRRAHPLASDRDAIVEGLARTGRVISFAAALMVVVFGAFAFSAYLPTQLLGFVLAVAVLADVTLVRMAVGPALLQLAGRWNWWPGDVRRSRRHGSA